MVRPLCYASRAMSASSSPRRIAHVDMDAFYASVEIRDDPSLAGKPVVVGGASDQRGVVAAASYEARKFGVHSAMPMARALRLCPDLVRLPGDPAKYAEVSRRVFEILERFSPAVETISLDEGFLDVTGTEAHFGPPKELARRIKDTIREAVALTASVGVAPSKFVAKLASDHGKPDGLVVVEPSEVLAFLHPLPIERLWGVGAKTAPRLHALGIQTIGDLAARDAVWARTQLGEHGLVLRELALGKDDRPVVPDQAYKSISSEMTFATDLEDRARLLGLVADQARTVAARMRREGLLARTVQLKMRDDTFATRTRRKTLGAPTDDGDTIYRAARALLEADPLERPLRLIGVGVSGLSEAAAQTLSLFDAVQEPDRAADQRFQQALDALEGKFGKGAVRRGQALLAGDVEDTGTDLGKRE
jgi:DNA polymerase IV